MKKNSISIQIIIIFSTLFLFAIGCGSRNHDKKQSAYDTPNEGSIKISVDESFKPVVDEQIKIYHADHPDVRIVAEYKSEADCFKDIQNDSTRMIIVGRGLTKNEFEILKGNIGFYPKNFRLAWDGVCIIVNAQSKDSVFTRKELNTIATSTVRTNKTLVVDGLNATSTVLYLQDSIALGKALGVNVKGVNGSQAVIDYVANNIDAIGIVGSSWVGNPYDPQQVKYFDKIHLAFVEATRDSLGRFVKPSQATISNDLYPFFRPIWAIVKENTTQLGMGFVGFMREERGQLIFLRANLVPAQIYFGIRQVKIDNK